MRLARHLSVLGALFCLASFAGAGGASPHEAFDALLHRYVADGRVDYAAWRSAGDDVAELSRYVDALESTDAEGLRDADALAFWINLYNAATLELLLTSDEVDSIKKLGGLLSSPWKRELVEVQGEKLSLDQIENEIIRPRFGDARIHFALNCAAVSCPPLQSFAFEGALLDQQLDRVTREAVGDPRFVDGSGCETGEGRIRLSKIFDWYRADFEESHGGLLEFIRAYGAVAGACKIDFMDYDWALNAKGE